MTRRKALLALAATATLISITSCTDPGARKDLPQNSQTFNEEAVEVILMPDGFPNVAHKCDDDKTGIWTTTDRAVWIVYNDPACGAAIPEGSGPAILDNIPGSSSSSAGG